MMNKTTASATVNSDAKVVNLTPHEITLVYPETNVVIERIPSEGVARVTSASKIIGEIGNIPITIKTFGEVEGLPEASDDTYYIVSSIVAQACPERKDLLIPDATVRDEKGAVIGCAALSLGNA